MEDEPDLGRAVQQALNREKYPVDRVQNGDEAWNYLESDRSEYTVTVLDRLLPGLSGLELCKRLRARKNPYPFSC